MSRTFVGWKKAGLISRSVLMLSGPPELECQTRKRNLGVTFIRFSVSVRLGGSRFLLFMPSSIGVMDQRCRQLPLGGVSFRRAREFTLFSNVIRTMTAMMIIWCRGNSKSGYLVCYAIVCYLAIIEPSNKDI